MIATGISINLILLPCCLILERRPKKSPRNERYQFLNRDLPYLDAIKSIDLSRNAVTETPDVKINLQ
jgi:hypothetical protein